MMRRSVTLVTAASSLPVTADELRAWARIDDSEPASVLEMLIGSATDAAERFMNRSLITQTLKLTLDLHPTAANAYLSDGVYDLPTTEMYGCPPPVIDLPRGPVQSITNIKTYDTSNTEATFSSANYTLDTAGSRVFLNSGAAWPTNMRSFAACAITYATGYGNASAVPKAIKNGILIHAASLYEQRGQCEDAMDIPPGSRQLYNQFRIHGGRVA